jgi:hypothetical protein
MANAPNDPNHKAIANYLHKPLTRMKLNALKLSCLRQQK